MVLFPFFLLSPFIPPSSFSAPLPLPPISSSPLLRFWARPPSPPLLVLRRHHLLCSLLPRPPPSSSAWSVRTRRPPRRAPRRGRRSSRKRSRRTPSRRAGKLSQGSSERCRFFTYRTTKVYQVQCPATVAVPWLTRLSVSRIRSLRLQSIEGRRRRPIQLFTGSVRARSTPPFSSFLPLFRGVQHISIWYSISFAPHA